jgi:CheY-like chemotaxis protein
MTTTSLPPVVDSDALKTILIVDPDERFATLVAHQLEQRGWQTTRVPDGRSALRELGQARADVLLTELEGEGLDAFELLEALANRPGRPAFVLCTRRAIGDALPMDTLATLDVAAVVTRPCRLDAVVEAAELARAARAPSLPPVPSPSPSLSPNARKVSA